MLNKVWNIGVYPDMSYNPDYEPGLVKDYVKDRTLDALIGCTIQNVYEDYLEYCNGRFNPLSKIMFCKGLKENYNCRNIIRKIDGKSYRILVSGNFKELQRGSKIK